MSPLVAASPPVTEGLASSAVVVAVTLVIWFAVDFIGRRMVARAVRSTGGEADIRADERAQRVQTLWHVGRLVFALVLIGVLVLLLFNIWGIPTSPFIAVGSVIGIALGFGAQDFVKDVIAGGFIIAEDQYGLDDVVSIADVSGRVEAIRLRTTVLRDLDGNVHHVPNGSIVVASNYTQEYAQVVIDLGVAYEANIDEVMVVIQDEVDRYFEDPEWELAFLDPPEMLGVERFADSSIVVRMMFKVRPAYRWSARREFLRRIKIRFDAEGIEIPYPHLTIVRSEAPRDEAPGHADPPAQA